MKFTQDDFVILFLLTLGGLVFGLTAGAIVLGGIEQIKGSAVLLEGVFIQNQGDGTFRLVSTAEGIGALYTNLPLALVLPVGRCYQVSMNETSKPIRISLEVKPALPENCFSNISVIISQNTTTTTVETTNPENQSAYYYRDELGLHISYQGSVASLNTTLLPEVPLNTCYQLAINYDRSIKQLNVETRPTEQSYCGLP